MTKRLQLLLVPALGWLVLRILWASYRIRISEEAEQRLEQLPQPTIFAFWHDQILVGSVFLVRRLVRRGHPVSVMVSPSHDGELVARTVRPLGITVVRGSSSRDGARALRGLYRHVTREGTSSILLPDGPRGPAYVAKPGTVVLAQMTGAPIAPLAFRVRRAWTLGSWDRMKLPLPFSRIDVHVGESWTVPRKLGNNDLQTHTGDLARRLDALRRTAEESR